MLADWASKRRPVCIFAAACFGLNLISVPMLEWAADMDLDVEGGILVSGLFFGEFLLCIATAAFFGRNWLEGFAFGIGLALAGTVSVTVSALFSQHFVQLGGRINWLGLLWLPWIIMSACAIPWGFRFWRHWRFDFVPTQPPIFPPPAERFGIRDLLAGTTLMASAIIFIRVPMVFWEHDPWAVGGIAAVVTCACLIASSIVLIPSLYISFRIRDAWLRRLAMPFLWFCLAMLAGLLLLGLEESSGIVFFDASEATLATSGFLAVSLLMLFGGLALARISGYAWTFRTTPSAGHPHPSAIPVRNTRSGFIISFAFLCAAALANSAAIWTQHRRGQMVQALQERARQLFEHGGAMQIQDRKVVAFTAWPDMDDDAFRELDLTGIDTLCLADSAITDASLKRVIDLNVSTLDLSRTAITDRGLEKLGRDLGYFQDLSVAGTRVTPDALVKLTNLVPIYGLNANDLGITDSDLKRMDLSKLDSLSIVGNPISDSGTQCLTSIERLELGRNQIVGSNFGFLANTKSLVLDEFAITDAEFATLAASARELYSLTLRRTSLTDAALPSVADLDLDYLELGEGNFTDAGLANCKIRLLYGLDLHAKQFTGACFQKWSVSLTTLSMRGSGISDESIKYLRNLAGLDSLDLSDTSISDRGLAVVKALNLQEVNLSGTQVTPAGIRSLQPIRVVVFPDQFSRDEFAKLRAQGIELEHFMRLQ